MIFPGFLISIASNDSGVVSIIPLGFFITLVYKQLNFFLGGDIFCKKKIKRQTIKFKNPVYIISTSSTVGPKEGEGPLKDFFDLILEDSLYGEISWEKAI